MSEAVPKILGRYEIQEEIGRGMMGVVYRALDPALGRTVALKTVRLAFAIPDAERGVFEKRFLAEARVAAGLSHPGIVVVHDVGRDEETGTVFIALEYLHGETLSQKTADGATLEWREVLRLTARIAEALHHAHAQGIVHRDIKPANIMVLPTGEPKIMDFGIAKVPASQLTTAGEFFGTPSYMSPEQATGSSVDGRSDLFSLGSVLYLILTGRRAFDAPNVPAILARVANQDPPAPTSLVPGLPRDVDYLVARALAKAPADRYPDGRSLAEDVDDVLSGRPPRHRKGWKQPVRADGTWVSLEPLDDAEAEPDVARPKPQTRTAPLRGASPAAARARGEASLLLRISDRLGQRGLLVLAALAGALLVAALLLPRSQAPAAPGPTASLAPVSGETPEEPPPRPTPSSPSIFRLPFLKEKAQLEIAFEHSERTGSLNVWVDDDLVLEEKLESRVVRKIGPVRIRKGSVRKVLDVPAGEHVIKVQIQGDDFTGSSRIKGTFESGEKKRLEVNRGGLPLMKKGVDLEWS